MAPVYLGGDFRAGGICYSLWCGPAAMLLEVCKYRIPPKRALIRSKQHDNAPVMFASPVFLFPLRNEYVGVC